MSSSRSSQQKGTEGMIDVESGSVRPRTWTDGGSVVSSVAPTFVPLSTTKALLLSVTVPKIHRIYIPPKEQAQVSADAKRKSKENLAKLLPPKAAISNQIKDSNTEEGSKATASSRTSSNEEALKSTRTTNRKLLKPSGSTISAASGYSTLSGVQRRELMSRNELPVKALLGSSGDNVSSSDLSISEKIPSGNPSPDDPRALMPLLHKARQERELGGQQGNTSDGEVENLGKLSPPPKSAVDTGATDTPTGQGSMPVSPKTEDGTPEIRVVEIRSQSLEKNKGSAPMSSGILVQEHNVGYIEKEEKNGSVEDVIAPEEMALVVKLDEAAEGMETEKAGEFDGSGNAGDEEERLRKERQGHQKITSEMKDQISSHLPQKHVQDEKAPFTAITSQPNDDELTTGDPLDRSLAGPITGSLSEMVTGKDTSSPVGVQKQQKEDFSTTTSTNTGNQWINTDISIFTEISGWAFGIMNKDDDDLLTSYMSLEEATTAMRQYDSQLSLSSQKATNVTASTKDDNVNQGVLEDLKGQPIAEKGIAATSIQKAGAAQVPVGGTVDKTIKHNPRSPVKPNTEIKLEELLRLTIRNLSAEKKHFFNTPIFSSIQSYSMIDASQSEEQTAKRSSKIDGQEGSPTSPDAFSSPDEWVELSVMIKQASIGMILERLERIGIGTSVGNIAIYKTELLRTSQPIQPPLQSEASTTEVGSNVVSEDDTKSGRSQATMKAANSGNEAESLAAAEKALKIETARTEWKNAASRLRVEQVKEQIQEQAELSLDYLALLTIASILAGIGLINNNAVVIVASMLVSPIMGPVMGITFGSCILDWKLASKSILHESVSLLITVIIGAIIGICSAFSDIANEWPTDEMESRGTKSGLWTGIAIAIPSGMGVALSILGNNTSSLVGVAISASLLPPAVNAGICWIYAWLLRGDRVDRDSDADSEDFTRIGIFSFALTLLNIFFIWVSGIFMFHIKEVAPTKSKSAFWSRDIKLARAVQQGSTKVNLDKVKEALQGDIKQERKRNKSKKKPLHERRILTFNMAVNPVADAELIVDVDELVGSPPSADATHEYSSVADLDQYFAELH